MNFHTLLVCPGLGFAMEEAEEQFAVSPYLKLMRGVWFTILILGTTVPGVNMLLNFHFLPSVEFSQNTFILRIVLGLLSAALSAWVMVADKSIHRDTGEGKKIFLQLMSPFIGFLCGHTAIVSVALLFSLIAGGPMELEFTVAATDQASSRWCHLPVSLEGVPVIFQQVCFASEEQRSSFTPGACAVAIGRGIRFGVNAVHLRPMDWPCKGRTGSAT